MQGASRAAVTRWLQVDMCNRMIDQGADVDCVHTVQSESAALGTWRCGQQPLHIAVSQGFLQTMRLLLSRGANKDHTTEGGETSLALAARTANSAIVHELLSQVAYSAAGPVCEALAVRDAL